MADTKKRTKFELYEGDECIAHGVMYEQGNGQVLWCKRHGWTGMQFALLHSLMEIFPEADVFKKV